MPVDDAKIACAKAERTAGAQILDATDITDLKQPEIVRGSRPWREPVKGPMSGGVTDTGISSVFQHTLRVPKTHTLSRSRDERDDR